MFYLWASFEIFSLLPLIYGLRIYRRFDGELRLFYWYLLAGFLNWLVGLFVVLQAKNTLWIANIFLPIELAFLLWLFSLWEKHDSIQLAMRVTIILFVLVWLAEISFLKNLREFSQISSPMENIILIIASFLIIHDANKDSEIMLTDQPRFWIATGILLSSSGVVVILILSNWLLKFYPDIFRYAIFVSPISSSVAQILFFGGFRCHYRLQTSGG